MVLDGRACLLELVARFPSYLAPEGTVSTEILAFMHLGVVCDCGGVHIVARINIHETSIF
jgi:hypothetical protein